MRRRKRFLVLLTLCLALILLETPSSARAAEFEPALFLEGRSLEKYISFPKQEADVSLTLRCQSNVTTVGRLRTASCYLFKDDGKDIYWYILAINRGLFRARLTPARVGGIRQEVLIHFSVRFERRDGVESIVVALNHGANAALYGDDYLDPQLYWRPATAIRGCVSLINVSWAVSVVDSAGKVLQNVIAPVSMSAVCRGSLEEYLIGSRYIPAFSEGKPVDAYFGNPLVR